jgi:hypothetical protein
MNSGNTQTRYVRIPAEIVVEVTDEAAVRAAARAAVEATDDMPADERIEAFERIEDEDISDAVALVVNLDALFEDVEGLDIVEMTWSAEEVEEYELIEDEELDN